MPQPNRNSRRARRRRQIIRNRIIFAVICLVLLAGIVYGCIRLTGFIRGKLVPPESLTAIQAREQESDEEYEGTESLGETLVSSQSDWRLILVNGNLSLPEHYTVQTEVADDNTGKTLQTEAAQAYRNMAAAAAADGVELMLCSGYRSVEYQQGLFEKKVQQYLDKGKTREEAEAEASTIVAVPGHSEHNTGLAADIVAPDHQVLDTAFEETPAFAWLQEHAAEYGFVLRYPNNKSAITGIIYEPWHYRYVGPENAAQMNLTGACLEEFAARQNITEFHESQNEQ